MDKKENFFWHKYINKWTLIPFVHFLLTFIMERRVFKLSMDGWQEFWSVTLDDSISHRTESVLLYIFAKVTAGILIFLFWNLVNKACTQKIPKHITRIFIIVFALFGVYCLLFWPHSFQWKDSYLIYGYALRLIPWYWHHFLTSVWFAACMMVLPHPIIILFIQVFGVCLVFTYTYYKIESEYNPKWWGKAILFIAFLAPETFWLASHAYRNCIYTILLMFYVVMLITDNHAETGISTGKIIAIGALSALLSTWRTEGIFVGVVGVIICIFKIYKLNKKKSIGMILIFLAVYYAISSVQKIGDTKYYGKDYLIFSMIEPLRTVLNDKNVNLDYKGAEDDLAALELYAPIEYIKSEGLLSVRLYYWMNGHVDFDQSMVPISDQKKVIKAIINIALHNPMPYFKNQFNYACEALELPLEFKLDEYSGPPVSIPKDQYYYYTWEIGSRDYFNRNGLAFFMDNPILRRLENFRVFSEEYRDFMRDYSIMGAVRVIIMLGGIYIFVHDIVALIKKKKPNIVFICFIGLFMVQFAVISATIPIGYSFYYYAVFYPCLLCEILWLYEKKSIKNK